MNKRWFFSPTVTFVLMALTAHAFALSNYRADLEATRFGSIDINLTGVIEFNTNNQDQWLFRLSAKGGPIKSVETSTGDLFDGQFRPLDYQRESKVLFIKENLEWHFNWAEDYVSGQYKKDKLQHTGITGLQDPVSFQFAMRQALNNGETQFSYPFLKHKGRSVVAFEVIGEELLTIGGQDIHTKIIKQLKPLKKDEQKFLWVASEYDHIPVRYKTTEKNKLKETIRVKRLWVDGQEITPSL